MDSISLLHVVSYVTILIFFAGFAVKAIRYATAPIHLRWELYPVAHEVGHKSGGSYLEELDWRTKPRKKSLIGELTFMAKEFLFFRGYYHRNRQIWYFVYPFHIAGYLFVVWLVVLLIGALATLADLPISAGSASLWGQIIYYLTLAAGLASFMIGTILSMSLLIKRSVDENLKTYTTPIDYFNLSFVLAIFASGLVAWLLSDPTFHIAREYMKSLITLNPMPAMSPAIITHIMIVCLFLIYMPFTRMTHSIAKYFTFHRVRWEDEPNVRKGEMEKKIEELLNQPVSWSASHIQPGKRWSELAASETVSEVKHGEEKKNSKN